MKNGKLSHIFFEKKVFLLAFSLSILAILTLLLANLMFSTIPKYSSRKTARPHSDYVPPPLNTSASSNTTLPSDQGQWLTYNGSNLRDGLDISDGTFTHLAIAWKSEKLDGGVFGQPLVYGRSVFVATTNNTIYSLDASTGRINWSNHLASPVVANQLPCGDINPVGIVSTPAIDPSRNEIFAVGDVDTNGSSSVHHELWGLDTYTGKLDLSVNVDAPNIIPVNQMQRAALAIAHNKVYIGFGGNDGDCALYHGYVVAAPEDGNSQPLYYQVPTIREGAIWAPGGISVDSEGNIFVATGNGSSRSAYDFGNSVLELSSTLKLEDYFAPSDWISYNVQDLDLGSVQPMILPNNLIFQTGKEERGFLLRKNNLGRIGGELSSATDCFAIGSSSSDDTNNIFLPCVRTGVEESTINTMTNSLSLAWKAPTEVSGSPIVVDGSIIVANYANGYLYSLNSRNGQIYSDLYLGDLEHFQCPSVGDGHLFIGAKNQVTALVS